ncbi:RES family NAD+ phosphorylase [Rhodoblastus sp.]|uniref:RES family NAD+ phosphorylase n=1 Tax=Rhodoblastus sp. TaxID=1962975 RepID=UPI003F96D15C
MQAWRLCRAPFADLSGEGARLYGGRWNSPGHAMVYAADEPALAVLEVRVHLDLPPELIPDDYVLMKFDLSGLAVEDLAVLPADPRAFGDQWLEQRRSPILRVPSFIVPDASNLLLNPTHPQAADAKIVGVNPFAFDPRLWAPL